MSSFIINHYVILIAINQKQWLLTWFIHKSFSNRCSVILIQIKELAIITTSLSARDFE